MPIRPDLKPLYPKDWPAISHRIRFERAGGRCEGCGRVHGEMVAGWKPGRTTIIVLTTAHLNHDPTDNSDANLRAWCQRCHLAHDRPHHAAQRRLRWWSRWRAGWVVADLFAAIDGPVPP